MNDENAGELRATFASLRDGLEGAEALALNARPEVLVRCASALSTAVSRLEATRSEIARHRGNAALLSEAREIRRAVERIHLLIDHAGRFHAGRQRVLGSMLAGYTAGGATADWCPPARVSVRA